MSACYCDYDAPVLYKAARRNARKEHRCGECSRRIVPGETYEDAQGMMPGGDFYYAKTCSHCLDIRQYVQNSVPCFCWAHGSMEEDAENAIADAYYRARDEVKGLWFAVGRLVVARNRAKRSARA